MTKIHCHLSEGRFNLVKHGNPFLLDSCPHKPRNPVLKNLSRKTSKWVNMEFYRYPEPIKNTYISVYIYIYLHIYIFNIEEYWTKISHTLEAYASWKIQLNNNDLVFLIPISQNAGFTLSWFRLPPATKAPRGRPSPRRRAEENEKKEAETGGSG